MREKEAIGVPTGVQKILGVFGKGGDVKGGQVSVGNLEL